MDLKDGDVLLAQIVKAQKDSVDAVIKTGQVVQAYALGRKDVVEESHAGLVVDLRKPEERSRRAKDGLTLGAPSTTEQPSDTYAHMIHLEPDGMISCPLTVGDVQRPASPWSVLRCNVPGLAAWASKIAAELFLATDYGARADYAWLQYGEIGLRIGGDLLDSFVSAYAQVLTKLGLKGLAQRAASALQYMARDASGGQFSTLSSGARAEIAELFERYYGEARVPEGSLSISQVCSSWVILCYRLALAQQWHSNLPLPAHIGPHAVQSPTQMRALLVESGLFDVVGTIDAQYETVRPGYEAKYPWDKTLSPLYTSEQYRKAYGDRLQHKAVRLSRELFGIWGGPSGERTESKARL